MAPVIEHLKLWETEAPFSQIAEETIGDSVITVSGGGWEGGRGKEEGGRGKEEEGRKREEGREERKGGREGGRERGSEVKDGERGQGRRRERRMMTVQLPRKEEEEMEYVHSYILWYPYHFSLCLLLRWASYKWDCLEGMIYALNLKPCLNNYPFMYR